MGRLIVFIRKVVMENRVKQLLQVVAEASKAPNNSIHQYQINRDFGYLQGMLTILELVEEYQVNGAEVSRVLDEIEADYQPATSSNKVG